MFNKLHIMVVLASIVVIVLLFRASPSIEEPPAYLISPPTDAQTFTVEEPLINSFLIKGLVGQDAGKNNKITSVYLTLQENLGKPEIKLQQGQIITGEVYVIQGPGLAIKNVKAENAGLFAGEYEDKTRKSINDLLNNLILVQKGRKLEYIQIQPGQLVLYYQL